MKNWWNTFRNQLPALEALNIPRWLNTSSTANLTELHGFCDASHLAMAAVMYLHKRVINGAGETKVTLICAKTRVVPLKRLTIPRLELSAALLLSRLVSHVQRALNFSEISTYLWTDSSVTLTWLSTHPSKWKDFVRNRVTTIQEALPSAFWQFVPGMQNPADCASRGIPTKQLETHALWWTGPP